jgi:hypothetical protein
MCNFILEQKLNQAMHHMFAKGDIIQIGSLILTGMAQKMSEYKISIPRQINLLTILLDDKKFVTEVVETTSDLTKLFQQFVNGLSKHPEKAKKTFKSKVDAKVLAETHQLAAESLLRMSCKLGSMLGGYLQSDDSDNIDNIFSRNTFIDFITGCFETVTLNIKVDDSSDCYGIAKHLVNEKKDIMQDYNYVSKLYKRTKISKQAHSELLEDFKKTTIKVALSHSAQSEEDYTTH